MKTIITDLQYFPPVNLYITLSKGSYIEFERYENWQKMSFRNRCTLAGSDGMLNLSIPLIGGRDQRSMTKDVRIADNTNWRTIHWRTIVSAYNRSPWFEYYRDSLENLFLMKADFLMDWNLACFDWVNDQLKLNLQTAFTDSYIGKYPPDVIDLRGSITPKTIKTSPVNISPYPQVFTERTGFIPNLSILDLLFCMGKNAAEILRNEEIS